MSTLASIDIETKDPHLDDWGPGSIRKDGYIIGIGCYCPEKKIDEFFSPTDERIKEILKDKSITKIFHNGVYDLDWIMNGPNHLEVNGRCEDTMTRETLLDSYAFSYSLDACCQRHGIVGKNKGTTIEEYWKQIGGKGKAIEHLDQIPMSIVGKYCKQDCKATYELFLSQQRPLEEQNLLNANDIECRLYPLLMDMRKNGIRLNMQELFKLSEQFQGEYEKGIEELETSYGFEKGSLSLNAASDLYKIWKQEGLPIEYTATGKPSFTSSILDDCIHPVAQKVKHLRGLIKTLSFFDSWVDLAIGDHLYPSFFPAKRDKGGTVTGRWSSSNPNCVTMDVRALTFEGYEYFNMHTSSLQTATGIKKVIGYMNASNRPVIRITTVDGHHIGATEDSKIAVWTERGIQWKEYKSLTIDDYVLIKIGSEVPGKECSQELAYMLGALGAEGWHLNFWNSDFNYALKYKQCASKVWGREVSMRESVRGDWDCHGWEIYVRDTLERQQKCQEWGFDYKAISRDKRVPRVIMQANKEAIISYIKAYIEGDGCIHSRQVAIYGNSLNMMRDIQLLLLRIGIYSFIEGPYRNNMYHLKISGHSLNTFRTLFGHSLKGKQIPVFKKGCAKDNVIPLILPYLNNKYGKYSKYLRNLNNGIGSQLSRQRALFFKDDPLLRDYINNDLQAVKISSIEHTIEDVYDYTVSETEGILGQPHFIANGFVQFDCQQIPAREDKHGKEIRSLFIPEDGYILGAFDYKQIEYRVFMHFASGDGAVTAQKQFVENPNTDYHQMTIDLMDWNDLGKEGRHLAKSLNFGSIYGLGPKSFATKFKQNLLHNHPERDPDNLFPVAQSLMNEYFRKVPFVKPTCNKIMEVGQKRGYVKTLSGRRQRLPSGECAYKLINYLIQGSASDLLKKGIVDAWEKGVFNVLKLHAQVHDEVVFSIPQTKEGYEACTTLYDCMANAYQLKIPIGVDTEIGPDWGHCNGTNWEEFKKSVA